MMTCQTCIGWMEKPADDTNRASAAIGKITNISPLFMLNTTFKNTSPTLCLLTFVFFFAEQNPMNQQSFKPLLSIRRHMISKPNRALFFLKRIVVVLSNSSYPLYSKWTDLWRCEIFVQLFYLSLATRLLSCKFLKHKVHI